MKKILTLTGVAMLLVAASCAKLAEKDVQPSNTAVVSVGLSGTKVSLGGRTDMVYKSVWDEGDAVVVNGTASEAIDASQAGKSVADFTVNYYLEAPYNVFYPASALGADGTVHFLTDQIYVEGQFDPNAVVLAGSSPTPAVSMHYACAFVKVTIAKSADETLKRVKLYSADETPMSGDYEIDYATASLNLIYNGKNYVSVSGEQGIAYNAQGKAEIVFCVPAGTYPGGFAVAATTTDGKQMSKKAYGTSGVSLVAGSLLEMPEFAFVDDGMAFSGGKGTVDTPYRIATSEDLQSLSDLCNSDASYADFASKAYLQVADIDMGSVDFMPICGKDVTSSFTGSYDGGNFSITNLAPDSFQGGANGIGMGMFGFIDGATLENITFDGCNFSGEGFIGALASVMRSGTVRGVSVKNSVIAAPGGTISSLGYSGGIVAEMQSGLIEACTVDGNTAISGKGYLGGIVGRITNNVQGGTSTLQCCSFDGTVTNKSGYTGGLVSLASTDNGKASTIIFDRCTSTGNIKGTQTNGGLVGYIRAYTTVKLSKCYCYGNVTGSTMYDGGLVGYVAAVDAFDMNECAAFGNVTGQYAVGGIFGYIVPNNANAKLVVRNTVYAGRKLTATGNNGANGYCLVGGIAGWWNNSAGYLQILNCASLVEQIAYPSTASSYPSKNPAVAGIVGFQNGTLTADCCIKGCYSLVQPCGFLTDGKYLIADNGSSTTAYYGGMYGKCANALVYDHCYWDNTLWRGPGTLTAMTNSDAFGPMSTLCDNLNAFVDNYSGEYALNKWSLEGMGYPTPNVDMVNPYSRPLRISVIGDSISTFRGWIPIGYAVYYFRNKTVDTKVCDVNDLDTYWNVLAYKLLPNAKIEKNIAWSGSCLSSVDGADRPGFNERFESSGLGAPDVVLIHGGTNDFNRNVNGSGKEVPNTEGYFYEDEVPASAMQKLYDTPADQLNTMNFLDAYVKLVKQIHEAHPDAKIVIVIGDRPTEAMEHGMLKIADHYDFVKAVDFRAAGYNNLPKFDGSHPTKAGHMTMATKIYNEVGSWIMDGAKGAGYGDPGDVSRDSSESTVIGF